MTPAENLGCRPYLFLKTSIAVAIRFTFCCLCRSSTSSAKLLMQSRKPSHPGCLFFLLVLRYTLLARAQENVSCYLPNGVAIADKTSSTDFYSACPISAGNDGTYMCCKSSSPFNDVCNEDGLCARQNDPSLGEQQGLLRSTCTDPTWTSPSCLKLCTTGFGKCCVRLLPRVTSKYDEAN